MYVDRYECIEPLGGLVMNNGSWNKIFVGIQYPQGYDVSCKHHLVKNGRCARLIRFLHERGFQDPYFTEGNATVMLFLVSV